MKHEQVDLKDTHSFSGFFLDYLSELIKLQPFYGEFPSLDGFEKQIQKRKLPAETRSTLVRVLEEQYANITVSGRTDQNITSLRSDQTFTVTTGHQLNIFTGPLYVIYKLVTIIRACDVLKQKFPDYNFVPVYWMASEDHDFAEINHFHFNGNTYTWNSDQKGAVGRFKTSDMKPLLQQLTQVPEFFLTAYSGNKSLAEAVRYYLNELFGEYGLVILDADNRELKEHFRKVMEDDITDQSIAPLVRKTTQELEELGYSTQINARDINFFYLSEDGRHRIENKDGGYILTDTEKTFTAEEMDEVIRNAPEKLSPNVVLRPLYQEMILPNLAYVGGPSELVYWLQLKGVFDHYDQPFPILLPRNFAVVIPEHVERTREATGISIREFFGSTDALLKTKIRAHSERELSLKNEESGLDEIFRAIHNKAMAIDQTLGSHVEAQQARLHKILERMEKKFIRAEKRHHKDLEQQIETVAAAIHPNGTLQERYENFLNFYQTDPQFISTLVERFDPFDFRLNVLTYGK